MDANREATTGRPRAFDAEAALERAMLVFWAQGYDGSSLDDLTGAMGITRSSMYRAFGNKEDLFRQALARYEQGPASYVEQALKQLSAREVASAFLGGAVLAATQSDLPRGCLGVQGSLAAGETGRVARDILTAWREGGAAHLRQRFQRAVTEGDLPPDADAGLLARYVMTVANGIAVQAAGGATRSELQLVAETAMRAWPQRGV